MNRKNYICPRCNYKTGLKSDMRRHLYRKLQCVNTNNLELTDYIRQKVLANHIFHRPKSLVPAPVQMPATGGRSYSSPPSLQNRAVVPKPEQDNIGANSLSNEQFRNMSQKSQSEHGITNREAICGFTNKNIKTVMDSQFKARPRSRSRPRTRSANLGAVGTIYIYFINIRFATREEALQYCANSGIAVNSSVLLSKEDLSGKHLIKIGKTEVCANGRQFDYTSDLLKEL